MRVETLFTGFENRAAAGQRLASALHRYRGKDDTIVVGLPRGGVVTAAALAEELGLPLDVLVIRTLTAPGSDELALGAIGPGGVRVLNEDVISMLGIDRREIDRIEQQERAMLECRDHLYRGDWPPLDCRGRKVILVADALASPSPVLAAISVIRRAGPARIILAAPIALLETLDHLCLYVDELVCLATPEPFRAAGYWYSDYAPVDDEEVQQTIVRAHVKGGAQVVSAQET